MAFSLFSDLITPTKYKVPDAPQLDVNAEQLAAISGNTTAFGASKKLATDYNDFMRQQVMKSLQAVPGYADLSSTMAKNLAAQLRGELTSSDAAATQRSSAAQALGMGIGGSAAGTALTARNLGLRQYQVQQNAQAQTPGWLSTMANVTRAPMYDFSNTFLSPGQRIQASMWNKEQAWNVQNLRNQMSVQPAPWMKALAGFGDSALTAATGYFTMGGGMGGGGGWSGGLTTGAAPSGWGGLSPFDQQQYLSIAHQGRQAGWGMNFE